MDNLRNLLLRLSTEVLSFFQQLQEARVNQNELFSEEMMTLKFDDIKLPAQAVVLAESKKSLDCL